MLYRGFVMAMLLILGTIWVAMAAVFVVAVAAAAHRRPLASDPILLSGDFSGPVRGSCRDRYHQILQPASN